MQSNITENTNHTVGMVGILVFMLSVFSVWIKDFRGRETFPGESIFISPFSTLSQLHTQPVFFFFSWKNKTIGTWTMGSSESLSRNPLLDAISAPPFLSLFTSEFCLFFFHAYCLFQISLVVFHPYWRKLKDWCFYPLSSFKVKKMNMHYMNLMYNNTFYFPKLFQKGVISLTQKALNSLMLL